MYVHKFIKILALFTILAFLGGCDAVDTILPSSSSYRVSKSVNGIPLDERSFIGFNDKIHLNFEESVSGDPDITGLIVFLRNSRGEIVGDKILYSLDGEAEQDEIVILVRSLDDELPSFPLPADLPVNRYTIVTQVMSGGDILQRNEKSFFYLGNAVFSFESINVHFPGVTENHQLIPRGLNILLEADLDFDSPLDPYIIWYNGRNRISEGRISDGAGLLFWKAPEQSGFFSIRAEVFPTASHHGLAGYQKEISLLVSSNTIDLHLVSEEIPQLLHWYIFDGNLNDSRITAAPADSLNPVPNIPLQWIPASGTYGLASGNNQAFLLPDIPIPDNSRDASWQTLFRFKPVNEGRLFSVLFESSPDISMNLNMEGDNLVLTLVSPAQTVSQTIMVPEQASFFSAGVSFSIRSGLLSARINILEDSVEQGELAVPPIAIEADITGNFQVLLGVEQEENVAANRRPFTVIWDEFALYNTPPMDIIVANMNRAN
jgi:predicted aconitase with swiveling domain